VFVFLCTSFIVYLVCLVCAWCVILCLLPYEAKKGIYLSSVCPASAREIGAKFRRFYRKSGLPSKNTTSDFASEVVNTPKVALNPKIGVCDCEPIATLR